MRSQKLKIVASAIALALVASSGAYSQESGAGNGGFIKEMRDAGKLGIHYMTEDEIRAFLEKNGKPLKEEIVLPLIQSTYIEDFTDLKVKETYRLMKEDVDLLRSDVNYTVIEEGICQTGEDLCTESLEPYSKITFNVSQIVSRQTTIAEFSGMVMHEFSHHYAGDKDHPMYGLAHFFKEKVATGKYAERTFTLKRNDSLGKFDGKGSVWAMLESNDAQARTFCEQQGFKQVVDYQSDPYRLLDDDYGNLQSWHYRKKAGTDNTYVEEFTSVRYGDHQLIYRITCR